MRSLKLDFLHLAPRPHWLAWLLLATGLGLAAGVAWHDRQVQHALDQAVAAAPHRVAYSMQRAATSAAGEEVSAAQSANEQLALPWGELFNRLETNRPKHIALISLEASANKTEATLTAEAKNADDMLGYVEQLKGEAGFASVTLASHALQESDPQQPLRFVLRLVWRR